MKNVVEIPERLRNYSAADLHKIANAMDMENGKQPQLTLHTAYEKAERAGVKVVLEPDIGLMYVERDGSRRECNTLSELMVSLRLGPVFFDLPIFYKGERCSILNETSKGAVIKTDSDKEHFVWYNGAERVLSN